VRYTSHDGLWQSAWVRLGSVNSGSVTNPNFGGNTIASCNLSCAASAAHLQAGAAKRCELGTAKCTQVRRIPPRSTGGGVIFGFDKLIGSNLRGGAHYCAY
jgi:hypothetical protein